MNSRAPSRLRRGARILAESAALLFVGYLALVVALRPWHRQWGSDVMERRRALHGDEHSASPSRAGNRAIRIDAPAEVVWQWLQQIGQDRGGFYSHALLERAFGLPIENASVIEPRWQHIEAGDFVRATPPDWLGGIFGDRIGWEVDAVVPERLLALRYWIFEIEPVSDTASRLHVRTHAGEPPLLAAPLLGFVFEPAHFIMERAMLQGIKTRAEHAAGERTLRALPY